eukprot:CAMPEP_0194267214 /NCGR_PEP_ID=MMETSP0169-20130528/1813_1 /TAXON_ID=218684 /ORGANISM="Corethron pennatum, Strain L29A3" /LENGTH=285 /DNA_ID=CAMNT_0039008025 /DNA_START=121 /DNA_END=978 /DNA_ORIENTATION=-
MEKSEDQESSNASIRWCHESSLGYEAAAGCASPRAPLAPVAPIGCGDVKDIANVEDNKALARCFGCGKENGSGATLLQCARCAVALYCTKKCQTADWKGNGTAGGTGHKHSCGVYKDVGKGMDFGASYAPPGTVRDRRRAAIAGLFRRVRLYLCPFAVHHSEAGAGRGFVFLQSPCTLAEIALPDPVLANGEGSSLRSVLMHRLVFAEFDTEVIRDDFEMATCRTELSAAVAEYDEEKEVVVCARFRCGGLFVFISPLVPEYRVCLALAGDYAGRDAVQLNIDDV